MLHWNILSYLYLEVHRNLFLGYHFYVFFNYHLPLRYTLEYIYMKGARATQGTSSRRALDTEIYLVRAIKQVIN